MSDRRILITGAILLGVIILCLFILNNIYVAEQRKVPEDKKVMIEAAGWPISEVPVMNNPNLVVKKYTDDLQMQEIEKGVSFEEYKEYLHELADAGFEADQSMGCEHPSRIGEHLNESNTEKFVWLAYKDNLYIRVIWAKEGTDKIISNVYMEVAKRLPPVQDVNDK